MKHYSIQLIDTVSGKSIDGSGGKAYVAKSGDAQKETLYTKAGGALANPITLTNGKLDFYVADTVVDVDLYVQAPSGHFVVAKDVVPSGETIYVDKGRSTTTYVIPFSIADTTATTETDTGFDLPTNAAVLPFGIGADILTADATETVDVGILSSESGGDADGFMSLLSVASAVSVMAADTVTVGGTESYFSSTTFGALINYFLAGANSAGDVGTVSKKAFVCDGTAKSISYTLTAGTDTAEGFIKLPVQLPYSSN